MRALYIQSFNVDKQALAHNLKHKKDKREKDAVVADNDKTILKQFKGF
jgi:predicted secreted acid phosphatase